MCSFCLATFCLRIKEKLKFQKRGLLKGFKIKFLKNG